jgi:hypothetical protein
MPYPAAEWVPWEAVDPGGLPAYYAGRNHPAAVVLHVMAGYASTARRWAIEGHFGASWHYTIGRDGHADGGYHAGISSAKARAHPPQWPLWRGARENINLYTVGIEHEGFPGEQFPPAQLAASRDLCRWLATDQSIPFDRDHFPPHAAIDILDRPNDFNTPVLREQYYRYLFEEETVTEEQVRRIVREEIAAFRELAIDERLREVMAAREALRRLASDPDAAILQQAIAALRAASLVP